MSRARYSKLLSGVSSCCRERAVGHRTVAHATVSLRLATLWSKHVATKEQAGNGSSFHEQTGSSREAEPCGVGDLTASGVLRPLTQPRKGTVPSRMAASEDACDAVTECHSDYELVRVREIEIYRRVADRPKGGRVTFVFLWVEG